jgi:hypothetical protein
MSYFMTTAGERIDLSDLAPLELVEASEAQNYLQNIASDISAADGEPLHLIHDGETGTSDNFSRLFTSMSNLFILLKVQLFSNY